MNEVNEWKDAMLDELAATHADAPVDEAPSRVLRRIIEWHVMLACDPGMQQENYLSEGSPV